MSTNDTAVNKDDLVLVQTPRPVHLAATRLNHAEWGKKTAVSDYLMRELALLSSKLTKQAHTSWALMHTNHAEKWAKWANLIEAEDDEQPPILAACEAFIRPAVVKRAGSEVEEETVMISIGSVFVQAKYRGKGYAQMLMVKLREWMLAQYPQGGFSNLYSDIGPKFYSRLGWQVYPSTSLQCLDVASTKTESTTNSLVQHLDWSAVETALFALNPVPFTTSKSVVAMPFRPATMDWFVRRSHYYYTLAEFSKPGLGLPAHFGAQNTHGNGDGIVIWNHLPEPSTLYLLHLRFDSLDGLSALLSASATEAKKWGLAKIEAYLSVEQEQRLREWEEQGQLGQGWSVVQRGQSLSSLMVWKQGRQLVETPSDEWEWVGNERYAWV